MRFQHVAGVLVLFATFLLPAQSGKMTADQKGDTSAPQSEKLAKMVGLTKSADSGMIFSTKSGKWKVSNPDRLKGHEGRALEITGAFDVANKTVRIEKINEMACGPKFCERQCKGKCGNGSACDCAKR